MKTTAQQILVGVTGRNENTAALRWAADEAAVTHAGVTLVHVVQPLPAPPPSMLIAADPPMSLGLELMREAVAEFGEVTGGQDCRSMVHAGSPARVLTDLSEGAALLVLAHRHLRGTCRVVTFSTTASVAAHAHCPVVAVPVDWQPPAEQRKWVTVGVPEGGAHASVLQAAFEAAAARRCTLRVVHAWRAEPRYEQVTLPGATTAQWDSHLREQVSEAVEPLADKYPDVPVDIVVRHQWPADALTELQSTSALLVVGRHGSISPFSGRLGSLARAVLRGTGCPVMIVPVS